MSAQPPIRQMTAEEKAAAPKDCYGCGRDAITWTEDESGELIGYCGYLDSGACLALIMAKTGRGF